MRRTFEVPPWLKHGESMVWNTNWCWIAGGSFRFTLLWNPSLLFAPGFKVNADLMQLSISLFYNLSGRSARSADGCWSGLWIVGGLSYRSHFSLCHKTALDVFRAVSTNPQALLVINNFMSHPVRFKNHATNWQAVNRRQGPRTSSTQYLKSKSEKTLKGHSDALVTVQTQTCGAIWHWRDTSFLLRWAYNGNGRGIEREEGRREQKQDPLFPRPMGRHGHIKGHFCHWYQQRCISIHMIVRLQIYGNHGNPPKGSTWDRLVRPNPDVCEEGWEGKHGLSSSHHHMHGKSQHVCLCFH